MTELINISSLRQPAWLLLLFIPLFSLIYRIISVRVALPLKHFDQSMHYWYLNTDTSVKAAGKRQLLLSFLFWLFFSLALSGPEYPQIIDSNISTTGDSVMVLLDVSKSMNSSDEAPTRLLRAKNELLNLIDKIKINDRLGVILFSGSSHLLFPPTNDKAAMTFFIENIKEDILPISGSLIDKALLYSQHLLTSDNTKGLFSHIILMTDGDVKSDKQVLSNIKALNINYPVYVVGVGQHINTPVPSQNYKQQWLLDSAGEIITSNRNDPLLQSIADYTGGDYIPLSSNKTKLDSIYLTKIKNQTTTEKEKGNTNWIQLYHLFLFIAVLIFFHQRILKLNH